MTGPVTLTLDPMAVEIAKRTARSLFAQGRAGELVIGQHCCKRAAAYKERDPALERITMTETELAAALVLAAESALRRVK